MDMDLIWTPVVLGGVVAVLFFICVRQSRRKDGQPPSAPTLPIVGSLLHVGTDPCKPLIVLQKKLGDVFTGKL